MGSRGAGRRREHPLDFRKTVKPRRRSAETPFAQGRRWKGGFFKASPRGEAVCRETRQTDEGCKVKAPRRISRAVDEVPLIRRGFAAPPSPEGEGLRGAICPPCIRHRRRSAETPEGEGFGLVSAERRQKKKEERINAVGFPAESRLQWAVLWYFSQILFTIFENSLKMVRKMRYNTLRRVVYL